MKYYKFADPSGQFVMSEEDILKEYYPWWKRGMERKGLTDLISKKNCIQDWCVVHWAEPATEEEYTNVTGTKRGRFLEK